MPIIRANALRSVLRQSGARATIRASGPARTQLVARRFASSGGHGGHGEPSSDLPWLLGALAITPPAVWYLWPEAHAEHHGDHGDGHDEHAEEGGEGEEEKPSEEDQSKEDEAPQEEAAPGEQAGEDSAPEKDAKPDTSDEQEAAKDSEETAKPSGSQGEAQPNPARSDAGEVVPKPGSAEKEKIEGVQFKGPMNEESAGNADTRKSEPNPSKGGRTKRIDSALGKSLGQGEAKDSEGKDNQAASKEISSSQGDISNKQKGISTTDARHSMKIDEDPEKSKKGSGGPETAKAKGTIDPKAPVR